MWTQIEILKVRDLLLGSLRSVVLLMLLCHMLLLGDRSGLQTGQSTCSLLQCGNAVVTHAECGLATLIK